MSSEHDSEHGLRDHPWCGHCEVPIHEARYGPCDWDARPATGWSADVQTMLAQLDPTLEDFMPRTPRESLQGELVDRARHYLTYSTEPGCDYDHEADSAALAEADQQAADERALRLYKPREALTPGVAPSFPDAPPGTPDLGSLGVRAVEIGQGQLDGATGDERSIWSAHLDVVTAADVTLRRVRYLWDQRVPLGAMTLMPGEEGIGKTTVGVRLIAELTRGTLPGEHYGTPRDAIVLATEDGLEDVFVPRLREAGADLSRVHIIRASIALDGDKRAVIVPRDLAYIGLLARHYNAAMVYIDSLVTTLPDELKSISYKDTAKVLKAVGNWAEVERVAVIAPWHLNKTSGSDTALRIMDSRAFRTAVRSMLLVVPDPDAAEGVTQGIVALDKANAGTLNVPGLRYRIRSASYTVTETDEETGEVRDVMASCSVADWIGEVDGDGRQIAREALTPAIEREGSPKTWLRNHLRAEGEVPRVDVIAAAGEEGFSLDQIKRASRSLAVHSREQTGRDEKTGRPWRSAIWSLPQSVHSHPTAPTAPTGETYQRPTTTTYAGQGKSVQLVQSVMDGPTVNEPPDYRPTGRESCGTCGKPLLLDAPERTECAACATDGEIS